MMGLGIIPKDLYQHLKTVGSWIGRQAGMLRLSIIDIKTKTRIDQPTYIPYIPTTYTYIHTHTASGEG